MFECHMTAPPDVEVDWLSNGKLIQPAQLNCKMHFDGRRLASRSQCGVLQARVSLHMDQLLEIFMGGVWSDFFCVSECLSPSR